MRTDDWRELVDRLGGGTTRSGVIESGAPAHRVQFDPGLSDTEVRRAEERYKFRFPPDLRELLQVALPRGPKFPDWRSGSVEEIREWLDLPRRGVLFDVEHNHFWLDAWGPRPGSLAEALQVANDLVLKAPRLIPVYSHRMIPDEPHLPGNPVLSVHQTDIIYYGFDLPDYLRHEFGLPGRKRWPEQVRRIRFWDPAEFEAACSPDSPRAFDNRRGVLP